MNHDIDVSENVRFSHPTKFGHTEVLIRSEYNYLLEKSKNILKEISNLTKEVKLNISYKDILLIEPGEILHKKGDKLENVYLVLSGLFKDYDTTGYERKYVQGDFLYTFNNEKRVKQSLELYHIVIF
ncbi:hypothetical protein EW093_13880 [Thiospirochaeta perfilievii]|uniref:Cyclic nucleotide-binding domain-containing protein n=1 Tax=Thiospirochaeta perfilievii TaxID=252967 RepID=A0A5C1QED1_9SPIO|nr:hypothetical protein [Thiospirochaeta perfilievii]QEN05747.1 hypothetical protein EW093_13880 [Thiospirochaeta perfilievii]